MKNKLQLPVQLLLLAGVLVVFNLLAGAYFFRIDLTGERRFTLSDITTQTLDTLKNVVHIRVYLEGENMPARLKRYRDAVQTTLLEMKTVAGTNLQFQFIDPSNDNGLQRYLADQGVNPIPIEWKDGAELNKRWLFPAAVMTYEGKEEIVNLLKGNCIYTQRGADCDFTRAESEIEYKITSQLQRMVNNDRRIIGIFQDSRATPMAQMPEFVEELKKLYEVVPVSCIAGKSIPPSKRYHSKTIQESVRHQGIDVLIIPQPDSALTERQKYEIDQYIMLGGRVLWLVDNVKVDERDFYTKEASTLPTPRSLNLEDMFFKYGFKLNTDLVQDDAAGLLEISFMQDNRPVIQPRKWVYFPYVTAFPTDSSKNAHPAAKNLDGVLLRYASSIDTLAVKGLQHKIAVVSSPYSRALGLQPIDLSRTIAQPPPRQVYKGKGFRILALSVEGQFTSLFMGRQAPTDALAPTPPTAPFVDHCPIDNRMMIISDGAITYPDHLKSGDGAMPVDNKTLLMNAVEYLIGESALAKLRAREVVVRRLDADKVVGKEPLIKALNVGLPIALLIGFGITRHWLRRRRNEKLKIQK